MLYNLILLLPCSVCLFGFVWMLCKIESNTRAQNILALCLLLTSVFFFCTANYIAGIPDYVTYRKIDILDCFVTPFIIPTMYLYFRSLTYEGRFAWWDYIWFLPAFVIGIGTYMSYLAMDEAQEVDYITSALINRSPDFRLDNPVYRLHYLFSIQLYSNLALLQVIGTVICALIYLKRYHYRLREFYSTVDDKSISLDYTILTWFMLTIPFALGIILIKETFWIQHPVFTSFFFIGYTVVYFGVCYYGSRTKYTVENLAHDLEQADLEAIRNNYDMPEDDTEDEVIDINETHGKSRYSRYLTSFNKLIDEDLIFLQSTLRADNMAARMCTNRTYLSRLIRDEFKCTFSDYINRKRIEYSQKLMREDPEIRLYDLSEQSGFANISSFGRTFKLIAGISPKKWLKDNVLRP